MANSDEARSPSVPLMTATPDWMHGKPMGWVEEYRARSVRATEMQREAIAMAQIASAMKETALDMRLCLWQERLTEQMCASRDTTLERALDAALSVASADCANIQALRSSGRGLLLIAQRGFSRSFLNYFELVDDGCTACGVAMREHRQVVVQDIASSSIFVGTRGLEVMLEAGIRSVKSTPLVGHDGLMLGVLSVHYREAPPRNDLELGRLQSLANTVARLIDSFERRCPAAGSDSRK